MLVKMRPIRDLLDPRLLILSVAIFLITYSARSVYEGSDPKFTLLVAQSIVENGTIRLDAYQDDELLGDPFQRHVGNVIRPLNGHYYNYFPVGPSILTVPIVAVTTGLGLDMRLAQHNFPLQRVLSSTISVIMLWIIYGIARCFLGVNQSIAIAGISVLGSGLISTIGSALWSINFSALFIGLSLLLLVRYETGRSSNVYPVLLGLLLFLGYFSRASTAAFIVVVLIYLLIKDRKKFLITGATAFIFLLLFAGWSRQEYGTWLPAYYSVSRFQSGKTPILLAIYGHLFSPSRGIFTFSPFFLLIIPGILLYGRRISRQPLVWLAVGWFGLHIIISSTAVSWWGGYSFGPRLLTETVLALVLLSVILWREAIKSLQPRWYKIGVASFLFLGAAGIFIHSYQGLYNINTAGWNEKFVPLPVPPIVGLDNLFDWRYPQFLATGDSLCRSQEERMRKVLENDSTLGSYQWRDPITYYGDSAVDFQLAAYISREDESTISPTVDSRIVSNAPATSAGSNYTFLPAILTPGNHGLFIGWTDTRAKEHIPYRWSECGTASIVFRLGDVSTQGNDFELAMTAGANGEQRSAVLLNGIKAGEWLFTSLPEQPETAILEFDGELLKPNSLNEITIQLPDARRLGWWDWRRLGLSFYQLSIYHVEEPPMPWAPPPVLTPQAYP
jgi:hypothetical protein